MYLEIVCLPRADGRAAGDCDSEELVGYRLAWASIRRPIAVGTRPVAPGFVTVRKS